MPTPLEKAAEAGKLRDKPERPSKAELDNHDNVIISPPTQGNSRAYTLARLDRDAPELAGKVKAAAFRTTKPVDSYALRNYGGCMPETRKSPDIATLLTPLKGDHDALRLVQALVDALGAPSERRVARFSRLAAREVLALRRDGRDEQAFTVESAAIKAVEQMREVRS